MGLKNCWKIVQMDHGLPKKNKGRHMDDYYILLKIVMIL